MRNLQVMPVLSLSSQFLPYRGEKEQSQTVVTQKGATSFQDCLDEALNKNSCRKGK